jgi:hypothetical protein
VPCARKFPPPPPPPPVRGGGGGGGGKARDVCAQLRLWGRASGLRATMWRQPAIYSGGHMMSNKHQPMHSSSSVAVRCVARFCILQPQDGPRVLPRRGLGYSHPGPHPAVPSPSPTAALAEAIFLSIYLYISISISIYIDREQQLQCWFPPDLSPLHNLLLLRQAACGARVTQVGSAKAVETPKHIRREGPVPTRLPPSIIDK